MVFVAVEWRYWWEPAPLSSAPENPIAGCVLIDSRKCDVMCEQHSTAPLVGGALASQSSTVPSSGSPVPPAGLKKRHKVFRVVWCCQYFAEFPLEHLEVPGHLASNPYLLVCSTPWIFSKIPRARVFQLCPTSTFLSNSQVWTHHKEGTCTKHTELFRDLDSLRIYIWIGRPCSENQLGLLPSGSFWAKGALRQ